jgi:hypothetical protein
MLVGSFGLGIPNAFLHSFFFRFLATELKWWTAIYKHDQTYKYVQP